MKNQEIQPSEIWNDKKSAAIKDFIFIKSQKQTKEQKLRMEQMAIQYKTEDCLLERTV